MKALSIKISCLLILLFYIAAPSFAKGLSAEETSQFLHDSGLNELIRSLPESIAQQFDVARLSQNIPANQKQVSRAVTLATKKVDGQKIAQVYLSKDNRALELSATLEFLASELGQKISAEERSSNTAEAQAKMQAYAHEQLAKPGDPEQAKLIQELSDVLNADEVVIKLMKGMYFSVLDTVELINASRAKHLKTQMEVEWQSLEAMLQQQLSSFMKMGASYSYRNLSLQELKSYVDFLKSESGQAYRQVGIDIIDLYMTGFVSELVAELSNGK